MVTGQTYPQYYQGYNNYQQYPQPVPVVQPPAQSIQSQVMAWVQSEDEALKYPLSAGQSIFLMNQNEDYLYMKCVDQLGKTTFVKKRLIDESSHPDNQIDLSSYIRKEELENLISDFVQKEVEKRVSEISFKATKPARRKTSLSDED